MMLALLMAACNGGDGTDTPDSLESPLADTPAVEGTGPEEPAPGGNGDPALPTAGLPIGGGSREDPAERQCVEVSWLGGDDAPLQDGLRVKVTKVDTDDRQGFRVSGFDCPNPPCQSYTFTEDDQTCDAAVTVTATYPETANLVMEGRVLCPAGKTALCRDFTGKLDGQQIEIFAPDGPAPPEETPTEQAPTEEETEAPTGEEPPPVTD